ncbi:hypothetical protein LTR13_002332 [Exophiala sideris]|nr:hypothetical protein LTR13_002332 [Exophiala sideris]
MDRSLDETIAERQRGQNRGGRRAPPPQRRKENNYPRDGVRKVKSKAPPCSVVTIDGRILSNHERIVASTFGASQDRDVLTVQLTKFFLHYSLLETIEQIWTSTKILAGEEVILNCYSDWVHDRYDDEPDSTKTAKFSVEEHRLTDKADFHGNDRSRGGRDRRRDNRSPEPDRTPPPARLRVDNLHYDLTEDDIYDLFTRIAPVKEARLRYDRAGRSEGVAFVTYEHVADARAAIKDFDGANAKGQPIRLTLLPLPRRDNPFDRVENPKTLFDRIEAPSSRNRRRSESPMEDVDEDRDSRRAPRRGGGRDRRSDVRGPAPENIDRYIPGQGASRSSSHRGGRRPGERRERAPRDPDGHKVVGGRPRKTAEELDAEMDNYWTSAGNGHAENGTDSKPAAQEAPPQGGDDIDMIE